MAFTGVAALVAGEATASVVLAAVTEVGLAMTVVGAVTGSKDLMKIGGVMSLVGGIGGMVAGAAGAGVGAAATTTESLGAADAAAGLIPEFGSEAAYTAALGDTSALSIVAPEAALSGTPSMGFAPGASSAAAPIAPTAPITPTAPGTMPVGNTPSVTDVATQQGNLGANAPVTPADYEVGGRLGPDDIDVGGGYNPASGRAPQTSDSLFSKFSSFAEKNKTLVQGGMQLVGGALKGANESAMWDKRIGLEQQRLSQTGYGNTAGQFAPIVTGARA